MSIEKGYYTTVKRAATYLIHKIHIHFFFSSLFMFITLWMFRHLGVHMHMLYVHAYSALFSMQFERLSIIKYTKVRAGTMSNIKIKIKVRSY